MNLNEHSREGIVVARSTVCACFYSGSTMNDAQHFVKQCNLVCIKRFPMTPLCGENSNDVHRLVASKVRILEKELIKIAPP